MKGTIQTTHPYQQRTKQGVTNNTEEMQEQQIKAKSGVIKKKPNGKFATGRPTDYKPEYCKDIVDYMSKEAHLIVIDKTYYKSPDFIQKNQVEIGIPVNEIAT